MWYQTKTGNNNSDWQWVTADGQAMLGTGDIYMYIDDWVHTLFELLRMISQSIRVT